MFAKVLVVLCAGWFTGAAIYFSAVEQPARLAGSTAVGLTEFRNGFLRAAGM